MQTQLRRALMALRFATIVLALASFGCATTAHRQVAAYGAEAAAIASKAQDTLIEADKSGTNPNKDLTARAMKGFSDLGAHLESFAKALVVFDALSPSEQEAQVPQLDKMIAEARRLVRVVLVFVPGETPLGDQLLKLFDNLDATFDTIRNSLRPATS